MSTVERHPKAARIGALLRKAERASTEEEANAYMTKAQALAAEYQIDLELARLAHSARMAPPVPTCRVITLGVKGKKGLFTFVELFHQIAHVNGVKIDIANDSTRVWAYGFNTDIELVEELYNSLVVQMVAASTHYMREGSWRDTWVYVERTSEIRPVSALSARLSFQKGFAQRIGARLREAKKTAVEQVQTSAGSGELVLVGRDLAVTDYYKSKSTAQGKYKGGRNTAISPRGMAAGREAGDKARLSKSAAIGGQRTAISA